MDYLISLGHQTEFECQDFAQKAQLFRMWFSDDAGFGHDCSDHKPGEAVRECPFRKVIKVN